MTTQTKHDGYAVFMPDGFPMMGTNAPLEELATRQAQESSGWSWGWMRQKGFRVHPVTITEVKDDE